MEWLAEVPHCWLTAPLLRLVQALVWLVARGRTRRPAVRPCRVLRRPPAVRGRYVAALRPPVPLASISALAAAGTVCAAAAKAAAAASVAGAAAVRIVPCAPERG